jgi:hypothetical protein
VWLTVGFFQVTNDKTIPVQLGPEYIWPSSQGVIRHKFFGIIDRTQLQVWPTYEPTTESRPGYTTAIGLPMVTSSTAINIANNSVATSITASINLVDATNNGITPALVNPPQKPNGVFNPNTNQTWYLPPLSPNKQPPPLGSPLQYFAVLTFEPDTDYEETVVVTSDGNGGYQATFTVKNPIRVDAKGNNYLHPAGCTVISRGNPGPWTAQYDPSQDSAVVPYTARLN